MLVSKMETSLKLFFIISVMFSATNCLSPEVSTNCSFSSARISTDQVEPTRHDVTLKVLPHRNILSGTTDITINVKKLTRNITLHSHYLYIDKTCTMIMKYGKQPRCHEEDAAYKLFRILHCRENRVTILFFSDYVSLGRHILHIEHFSFVEENKNEIFYPYSWKNETRWIVTNLYSSNAIQRLFPGWDDATIKEHLYIKVIYDKSYTVFTNIPTNIFYLLFTTQYDKDTLKTPISAIYPISTHSIVFMFISGLTNTTQYDINYLWQESNATVALEYAHTVAFRTTIQLKRIIHIDLSEILYKIDHIILSYGPMKSAGCLGLITYREKDVTYKEGVDSPGKMIDIAKLVSYEMSRQLFIGIMNSHLNMEDKWFDEILASFYSFYIADKIWLEKQMMELFVVQNLQTALDSDNYLEVEPIIHKSKNDYGIDGLLYPLLYHKKAFALIRMLLNLLPPLKFDEIIEKYVQSRNTSFWTIIEEVYPERYIQKYTVKEIMDSWLTEIHHPEITFTRNYNIKTVTYNATFPNNASNFKIPFTLRDNLQINTTVLWCERNETNSISQFDPNHFLLGNMEQFGYYRVNYDSRNWLLLAAHLQFRNLQSATSTPISVLSRAQIVNDAFYFTTTGKIESQIFFDVIKFLKDETSYIVWHPMFNIFSYMSAFLKSPMGDTTKANFLIILNSVLRKVGYEERETDNEMTMPLRLLAIKWACEFGHEESKRATAEKLIAHIRNSEKNITTWWTNWMYCTGMMDVNMNVSKLIWEQGIEEENMEILEHVTCIEDENILLHYLQLMSNMRVHEINANVSNYAKISMGKIHRSIIKKHIGKKKVLNYFLNNYFEIIDRFPNEFDTYDNLTLIGDIVMNVHNQLLLSMINMHVTQKFYLYKLWTNSKDLIEIRRNQILRQQKKFETFYD